MNAADDSRDYDYQKTTATAGSAYPGTGNEGPASYAVDGDTGTWWHTDWTANRADGRLLDHS